MKLGLTFLLVIAVAVCGCGNTCEDCEGGFAPGPRCGDTFCSQGASCVLVDATPTCSTTATRDQSFTNCGGIDSACGPGLSCVDAACAVDTGASDGPTHDR